MMRLWPLITDLIARLIARLIAVNGKIAITPRRASPRPGPARPGPARRTRTRTARPAAPRRASATATATARPGPARRGERARARVVHRPPLTGFTSGVHEVHLLSRLRSSSIPGTELSIDSLALIVGFKFF